MKTVEKQAPVSDETEGLFFIKVEVTLQGKEYKALFRCDSNSFRNLMILFQFTFKGPAGNT